MTRKVGVLALQGDFAEHMKSLESIGAEPTEVRLPDDLVDIDALIIPGGESTTIVRLIGRLWPDQRHQGAGQGRDARVGHVRRHDSPGREPGRGQAAGPWV